MSRASSYLPVLARHNNHTHPHPKYHHEPYNTQYFCALLEAGVEYMQTKHHQGQPFGVIDDDGDFLFQLREAIHAGRFYMLAVGVVLLYEYCITFDQEVELIWKRIKHCLVTPIFFLNRYVPLATYIFIVAGVQCANSDHEFCIGTFVRLPSALIVLCTVLIGIVRLILIWAFWKEDPKGKIFISGVLVTFMVQLSTSIACAVALQGIGPLYGRDPDKDQYGCFLVFQKGSMPRLIVHWFASMVFNILICYSIIKKLLGMPLFKATDNRDLAEVLLRDVKVMLL
ncbi:hypothetical protein BC629DRAFT_1535222 [Irpex lacteus]|nr:hypothetical protein BC629DRAFT_1535222 [Irpex lacteus]